MEDDAPPLIFGIRGMRRYMQDGPRCSSEVDTAEPTIDELRATGLRQMANEYDGQVVPLREFHQGRESGPDFVRTVHIDSGPEVRLDRIDDQEVRTHGRQGRVQNAEIPQGDGGCHVPLITSGSVDSSQCGNARDIRSGSLESRPDRVSQPIFGGHHEDGRGGTVYSYGGPQAGACPA